MLGGLLDLSSSYEYRSGDPVRATKSKVANIPNEERAAAAGMDTTPLKQVYGLATVEEDEEDEEDDDMGFMDAVEAAMDKGKKKAARKQKRQQRTAISLAQRRARKAKEDSGELIPFAAGMEEVESPSASTDYAGMPADGSAVGYNEEPAEEVDMSDMMSAYRGEEVDIGIDPDEGAFDITAGAPKAIPVAEAVYTPEQAQELFKVTHGEPFDPKAPADKKKMKEIEETLVEQGGLGDQTANQFALNIYRKYKYV